MKMDSFPSRGSEEEILSYCSTGNLHSQEPLGFINPTMFTLPHTYSLDVSSLPFVCVPPFASEYASRRPLQTMLEEHLSQWVRTIRKYGDRVKWEMDISDCLSLAASLPRTEMYDVVSASGAVSLSGIMPVLQSVKGLVKHSVLLSMTAHQNYMGRIHGLLRTHGGVMPSIHQWPLELFPALWGWRCIRFEGLLRNDLSCVAPGAEHMDDSFLLMFKPAPTADVLLDACDDSV